VTDGPCCDVDLSGGLGDEARELAVVGFATLWRGDPLPIGHRAEVVAAMAARGRCEVEGETVVGIHGLTLPTTRHHFVHRGTAHHTWCAFDSIGIPAALGLSSIAHTTCRACNAAIAVEMRDGVPDADEHLVLWLPDATGDHLMDTFCAAADLYCSVAHLRTQLGSDASGEEADLDRAAALGRETWADVADLGLR